VFLESVVDRGLEVTRELHHGFHAVLEISELSLRTPLCPSFVKRLDLIEKHSVLV